MFLLLFFHPMTGLYGRYFLGLELDIAIYSKLLSVGALPIGATAIRRWFSTFLFIYLLFLFITVVSCQKLCYMARLNGSNAL